MTRRVVYVSIAAFGALVSSTLACASWEWTQWGMKPDEVVAASKGKARLVKQPRTVLVGPVHLGTEYIARVDMPDVWLGTNIEILFLFDRRTNELTCVDLNTDRLRGENSAPAPKDTYAHLRSALVQKHGEPTREFGTPLVHGGFDEQAQWLEVDFIELRNLLNAGVYVRYCKRTSAL